MKEMEMFLIFSVYQLMKNENKVIDTDKYEVFEDKNGNRYLHAKDNNFNMYFRKSDGFTAKWGKTFDEDPAYNPFGNEIADIEITKRCKGIRNKNGVHTLCPYCYKSNCSKGDYMSFETFKKLFDVLNEAKTMTQIAFGTGASLTEDENPDYWKIFEYCKENGVTPNVTVADISEETAKKMVNTFGACAVSYYPLINKNRCYDTVEKLIRNAKEINKKMAINIHCLLADETYNGVMELLDDMKTDKRLEGLNAIVFLSLKQKGRGVHFNKLEYDKFKNIIARCMNENIPYGMDSCSANKFIKTLDELVDENKKNEIINFIEPCESFGLFSMYVDCYGTYYPCSFMEKTGKWENGIDLLKINDFCKEVWYSEKLCEDRNKSLEKAKCNGGCTSCPYYNI
jgi:hypothetical protein